MGKTENFTDPRKPVPIRTIIPEVDPEVEIFRKTRAPARGPAGDQNSPMTRE